MTTIQYPRKLYRRIRGRTAKKQLGGYWWRKLLYGLKLRPGDLVTTCAGWNSRIVEITPLWSHEGRFSGRYITDFNVRTLRMSCSLIHCCSVPTETREQIEQYWLSSDIPEQREWYENWSGQRYEDGWGKIAVALKAGKKPFNEYGEILPEEEW